jgi:hypothetical protein
MSDEEQSLLEINPNENITLSLSEVYQKHFELLKSQEEEIDLICRVIIQDQSGYGVMIPAILVEDKDISFCLPEQLCIFNPNNSYMLKVEIVLESELITPIFQPCSISLNALLEPAEEECEYDDKENLQASEEAIKELSRQDSELDVVLNAIAPLPVVEIKKTKVEDIVAQLDEEFVKNALWRKEPTRVKTQVAPVLMQEPEPPFNIENLAVKQKMKDLLRRMLG